MSKAASPTRFAGESDHFYDPNFTAEISQKMRVPKRIKVDGDTEDEVVSNLPANSWHNNEKFDMQVPDRILVLGHEQHFGTRAPPRELVLENTVMPPDPGVVRVQTPPRVLKLDEHYFPSADDFTPPPSENNHDFAIVRSKPRKDLDLDNDGRLDVRSATLREVTPGLTEGMSTSEEVIHLRRQLAKLNRRVMSIEVENLQRQQREKMMYAVGLAYFLFKALIWLNRSS